MTWQFNLINELALKYEAIENGLSNVPVEVSSNAKKQHLNFTLKKFYLPTIDNISDVSNQLLWLADPSMFNDPHDCELGIDENFKIYVLEQMARDTKLFTSQDRLNIYSARRRNQDIYSPKVIFYPCVKRSYAIIR